MNRKATIRIVVGGLFTSLLASPSAHAQNTFENLNFESGTVENPITDPYSGFNHQPIALGLPGWRASIGGVPVTEVLQNNYTIGTASIDLFGPGWVSIGPGIIDGNYTVFLQAFNQDQGNVSLWQNGMIPSNAESLQFRAWAWNHASLNEALTVSFAGNSLSPVPLGSGQSPSGQPYTVYGADITPYAGESGQLEFTAICGASPSWMELDDIIFSPNAVPEPNIVSMIAFGGLIFGAQYRCCGRR